MDDASAVSMAWNSKAQACVPDPAAELSQWENEQQLLEDVQVDGSDTIALLVHKFVAAARQLRPSIATRNLLHLYINDNYRSLLVEAARKGYRAGRDAALADWGKIFDEFIDQLIVVGVNSIDDPAALVVGTTATAVQAFGRNPFAESSPSTHRQLNDWIKKARQQIWAGVVPPSPPDMPDDDLAQIKAAFVVDVLAQVFSILSDPMSVVFASLSLPDICDEYQAAETAESSEQQGLLSALLNVVCEPESFGFTFGYRQGAVDVNTRFIIALRLADWVPIDLDLPF